jgi:hypothetical protein
MIIEGKEVSLVYARGYYDLVCDGISYGKDITKFIEALTGVEVILDSNEWVFRTSVLDPDSSQGCVFEKREWTALELDTTGSTQEEIEIFVHFLPSLDGVHTKEDGREFLKDLREFVVAALQSKKAYLSSWEVD